MRIQRALLLGPVLLLCGCGPEVPGSAGQGSSEPANPVTGPAEASLPERPADPARDESELIRLERDYAKALVQRDREFLMRFYAPDWRGGNWMGFWSKSTMLKSVLNERYVVRSMDVRDLKVRVLGDVAIVQGVDEEVTALGGRDTSGKWAFTDIFARRDGRWVAIASHTSEVRPTGE